MGSWPGRAVEGCKSMAPLLMMLLCRQGVQARCSRFPFLVVPLTTFRHPKPQLAPIASPHPPGIYQCHTNVSLPTKPRLQQK